MDLQREIWIVLQYLNENNNLTAGKPPSWKLCHVHWKAPFKRGISYECQTPILLDESN